MVPFQRTLVKESKDESSIGETFITKGHGTTYYNHRIRNLWTHSAFSIFPIFFTGNEKVLLANLLGAR